MTTVGFLGLGSWARGWPRTCSARGSTVRAWTRTAGKAAGVGRRAPGAPATTTPAEAAAGADVVISMVVDGDQVRRFLLDGAGRRGAAAAGPGRCSSTCRRSPRRTPRDIGARARRAGTCGFVDAPVTGSSPRAEDGTLTIMAGGSDDRRRTGACRRWRRWARRSSTSARSGHGQIIKLINNAVAAANAATLAQALVMGAGTGVDLEALTQILAAGSGNSTMVGLKAEPMRQHAYATLFKTEHMLKDVRLCIEEAQRAGVPFPAANSARDALVAAVGRGYARPGLRGDHRGLRGPRRSAHRRRLTARRRSI